ncbi:AGAMOUS-like 62 [Hibiscus trionum]|uniref:AGAMOUS-like 62 n=1 Tax=Hibiscus trionum TaxID=183268 RepID=A0A9W7H0B6_HIBTR|nr:AGAMOUS-like 62 [Hibiscus trionum]
MAGLVLKRSRRKNLKPTTKGENAHQDDYTERRSDFLNKSIELCNLCDLEVALNNSSPGSKAIRIGLPVDANIDRRGNREIQAVFEISREDAQSLVNIKKFSEEYSEVCKKLKAAKLRGKQLEQMKLENESKGEWLVDRPIDELNLEELLTLDAETTEFIEKLKKARQERLAKDAASTSMSTTGGSNSSPNGSSDGSSSVRPYEH